MTDELKEQTGSRDILRAAVARGEPVRQPSEDDVDVLEHMIGMSHGGWGEVNPRELIACSWKLAPPAQSAPCSLCDGSGMTLNYTGEPDKCSHCKGSTVEPVQSAVPEGYAIVEAAPSTGEAQGDVPDPRDKHRLLGACLMAYRKHHIGDDSIGWDELSQCLGDALANTIGTDEAVAAAIAAQRGDEA